MCLFDAVKKAKSSLGFIRDEGSLLLQLYQVRVFLFSFLFLGSVSKQDLGPRKLFILGFPFICNRKKLESTQKALEHVPIVGMLTGSVYTLKETPKRYSLHFLVHEIQKLD